MGKIFTGIDIIEIERIKQAVRDVKFADRVYTKKEIEIAEKRKNTKYEFYAGRFAAKEAIYKAMSSMQKINWHDVEILSDEIGRPIVNFVDENLKEYKEKISLSISHDKTQAVAICVLKGE